MDKYWPYILFSVLVLFHSCSEEDAAFQYDLVSITDFDNGSLDNWIVGFAQYPVGLEDSFKLSYRIDNSIAGNSDKSLIIGGKNCNNDLFMFVKGEIFGLEPESYYDVLVDIELYSKLLESFTEDMESEKTGSFLKVGALMNEPGISYKQDNELAGLKIAEMNIDIGEEYEGKENIINLGKLTYSEAGIEPILLRGYNLSTPIRVKTNSKGNIWLLIGIDSNISIYQEVYINYIGGRYSKKGS